jgi:hypothetical protein
MRNTKKGSKVAIFGIVVIVVMAVVAYIMKTILKDKKPVGPIRY